MSFKKLFLIFPAIVFIHFAAFTQKKNAAFEVHIHKATSPIIIDGIMNEDAWQQAETANNFFMVLPMDTSLARVKTDVLVTYDDRNFYLMAICYKDLAGHNMVESLRRDFNFGKNDNFLVFIDPFEDQTTGYSFGANAEGAQWDGTMYAGGSVDLNWDNKWVSAVKNYEDKWIFEAAIPFKTIRYKKDVLHWGINYSRNDLKTTEKSSWASRCQGNFQQHLLLIRATWFGMQHRRNLKAIFQSYLMFLQALQKIMTKQLFAGHIKQGRAGVDAKISFSTSMNLDLTVHPDFSRRLKLDQQLDITLAVLNYSFPEKRQFFFRERRPVWQFWLCRYTFLFFKKDRIEYINTMLGAYA